MISICFFSKTIDNRCQLNHLYREHSRFSTVFNHDKDSMPRVWTGKEDIRAITKEAQREVIFQSHATTKVYIDHPGCYILNRKIYSFAVFAASVHYGCSTFRRGNG